MKPIRFMLSTNGNTIFTMFEHTEKRVMIQRHVDGKPKYSTYDKEEALQNIKTDWWKEVDEHGNRK